MPRPDEASLPSRNRLLAALPPHDLARLSPRLEAVAMPHRASVQAADAPIEAVLFPETGYLSRLALLEDGSNVEVGLVGPEGMSGVSVLLGDDRDVFELTVQAPGTALRIGAEAFRDALDEIPSLRPLLLRYALSHFEGVARTAVCNGRHDIERRLARWLLMAHDRTEADGFPMTHDMLSMILGVRRPGVTAAAGFLRDAGLIRYAAGWIEVADRPGLERASCECYAASRRVQDRLLAAPGRARPLRCAPVSPPCFAARPPGRPRREARVPERASEGAPFAAA